MHGLRLGLGSILACTTSAFELSLYNLLTSFEIEYENTRSDMYRTALCRTGGVAVSENPFVVSLLARGEHFADREEELTRIRHAYCTPGGKLIVYGDRRLGKSSALERAAELARRDGYRVAIASFATASESSEAAQRVLSATQPEIGNHWREIVEAIGRRLRAGFQVSPAAGADGMPALRFHFALNDRWEVSLLPDVLDALNEQLLRRKLTLGLGLDEFQRIHEWGGEDAEWALREVMQRHDAIAYVLAGSRRHLIEAMVSSKSRALWKLADVMRFGPMAPDTLIPWLVARAGGAGVQLPVQEAHRVVTLAWPRTRDIVLLARRVWEEARATGTVSKAAADTAFETVVQEQAELFRSIFVKLTTRQQAVLRTFAADAHVQITAAATIRTYRLGPKSSVQSTVETLVEEEHLNRLDEGGYAFDDPFFRRWVQLNALPDIGIQPPQLAPSE